MIVSANISGVLEIFWRHRASTALSRITAEGFRSLRTRHADILLLRGWLALQPGCATVSRLDDARIMKRIAAAVQSGELACAEPPAGPRLPGTGVVVDSIYGPVLLLPHRKMSRAADLSRALAWVPDLSDENLKQVRAVLTDSDPSTRRSMYETDDLRAELIHRLKTGELIPVFTYYASHADAPVYEAPPAQPPDATRVTDPQDTTEQETFGPDHHVPAQVSAMSSAAESGVPFCEVCSRQQ